MAGGCGGADIWVSRRASLDSPWEAPVNLGSSVNTGGLEASPYVSSDGHMLFFSSDRNGSNDIYVARRDNTNDDFASGTPTLLGPGVNTSIFEAGEFYLQSAEDGPINFYFVRGAASTAPVKIFAAAIDRDGLTSGDAMPVTELNDPDPAVNDPRPMLRSDGREIFMASNRAGTLGGNDLWTSTRRSVHDPWSAPVNLGAPLNSTAQDNQPTLSHDARTLIFTSNRPGGLGANDLWMSTRTASGN